MKTEVFLVSCWIFTAVIMQGYWAFKFHFNNPEQYQGIIADLKAQVAREQLKNILLHEEKEDFRQEVLAILPEVLHQRGQGERGYPLRTLASVVSTTNLMAESLSASEKMAHTLLERGKLYFRNHQWGEARGIFQELISRYGFSIHAVEAHFLLAETYYKLGQFYDCVKIIHSMLAQYPHSELTGFAMLRLAEVSAAENRIDEARETYRTILRSFPNRDLASQALDSLRALE